MSFQDQNRKWPEERSWNRTKYLYDADGDRVLREDLGHGGRLTYFVRDAGSNVVSEWETDPGSTLSERRRYVYAANQTVASGAPCGPPPALQLQSSWNQATSIGFTKRDRTLTLAGEPYTLDIQPLVGQRSVYQTLLSSDTVNWVTFSIPKSAFLPNVTNRVRIQGEASCGGTGYSEEVDFIYSNASGSGSSCVNTLVGVRATDPSDGSTSLKLMWAGSCPSGTTYDLYFQPTNSSSAVLLTSSNNSGLHTVGNIGGSGGRGQYWAVPRAAGSGTPLPASVHLEMRLMVAIDVEDDGGSGGDFVPEPQGPPWVYRFHHVDHLGSTRVETDEMAHALATHAYYPYGTEIPPLQVSDNSHRFAGHERDNATSLDYMHARYYAGSLGRFLSTDPAHESVHPGNPQTWNRYSYVVNNPISSVDPDGRAVIGARLETDGLNKIPKPTADHELSIKPSELATLGPKVAPRGFMMGVNTIFVTSPDDKASNYHVGQKAVSFELQDPRTNSWKIVGKGPDKDDSPTPNNQNAQGRVLVSFDGPGGIVPKGVVPNNFTGTLVQYTKTQALDAKGNPSGPTLYWKTTVAVIDGTPTMTVDVIDENDFNTASDIFYGQKQRRHH